MICHGDVRVKGARMRRNKTAQSKKPAEYQLSGLRLIISLTITYFHTGCSTIIGAKSFHGPVRDGKGWYRLAMVIRLDLYECRSHERHSESGRSKFYICRGQQTAVIAPGFDCQGY